jgi:anti-sigma factor RsiW
MHERCWDAIPWLVNGRLPEAERQLFTTHAASCAECREELARHRELHREMRGADTEIETTHASWDKLLARIESEDADAQARASGASREHRGPWRGFIAALWIQGVGLALLAVALLGREWLAPEFATLSTTAAAAPTTSLRVVFSPDASVAQINRLLQDIGGQLKAGPSDAGVYTIAIDETNAGTAITRLRSQPVVLFAEQGFATTESKQ